MFILFLELNKRWLLFIFIPFLISVRWLLENKLKKENKNLFFNGFLRMCARVLNIIPWIILQKSISFKKRKQNSMPIDNKTENQVKDEESNQNSSHLESRLASSGSYSSLFEIEKEKKIQNILEKYKIEKQNKILIILILVLTGILDFISISSHFILSELS